MHFMTPEALVQEFRSGLISSLQELGTREATAAIRRVAATFKEEWWLSYAAVASERAWLRRTWTKVIPQTLLSMSTNHHARSVETSEQLAEAVIDSLWRLEARLHGETPAVVDLWDKDVPKDEMAVSDYIKRHLESDLNSLGVLAFREPEMRRGQETDIYVAALLRHPISGHSERIDLVIEVKGCWNTDLKKAMGSQLKGRYLHDRGGEGLYLVVWFSCERWADEHRKERTPDWPVAKAREFFSEQAAKLSNSRIRLHSFVLDAGRRT